MALPRLERKNVCTIVAWACVNMECKEGQDDGESDQSDVRDEWTVGILTCEARLDPWDRWSDTCSERVRVGNGD